MQPALIMGSIHFQSGNEGSNRQHRKHCNRLLPIVLQVSLQLPASQFAQRSGNGHKQVGLSQWQVRQYTSHNFDMAKAIQPSLHNAQRKYNEELQWQHVLAHPFRKQDAIRKAVVRECNHSGCLQVMAAMHVDGPIDTIRWQSQRRLEQSPCCQREPLVARGAVQQWPQARHRGLQCHRAGVQESTQEVQVGSQPLQKEVAPGGALILPNVNTSESLEGGGREKSVEKSPSVLGFHGNAFKA